MVFYGVISARQGLSTTDVIDRANEMGRVEGERAAYRCLHDHFQIANGSLSGTDRFKLEIQMWQWAQNWADITTLERHAKQALSLAQVSGISNQNIEALLVSGDTAYLKGDYPQALDYFQQAWHWVGPTTDYGLKADVLKNMGILERDLGDHTASLEHLMGALTLVDQYNQTGQRLWSIRLNLGMLYAQLGDRLQAANQYEAIARDPNLENIPMDWAALRVRQAFLDLQTGAITRAIERFESAIAVYRQYKPSELGWPLDGLCEALAAQGDVEQAITLRWSLVDSESGPDYGALLRFGNFYLKQDPAQALNFFLTAETKLPTLPSQVWRLYFGMARAYRALGDFERAAQSALKAIQLFEDYWDDFSSVGFRESLLGQNRDLFVEAVEIWVEWFRLEPSDENLNTLYFLCQRSKARQFLEAFPDQEKRLDPIQSAGLPIPPPEEICANLGSEDLLVDYLVCPNQVVVWVFNQERYQFFTLSISADALRLQSQIFNRSLQSDGDSTTQNELASQMGHLLLQPVLERLGYVPQRWLLAPDGVLKMVPFELLETVQSGVKGPLLRFVQVSLTPSASVFVGLKNRRLAAAESSVLLMGAPSDQDARPIESTPLQVYRNEGFVLEALPGTQKELDCVSNHFAHVTRLQGMDFNPDSIAKLSLAEYGVVHLATHGLHSQWDPQRSAFLCRDNSGNWVPICAETIRQWRLNADLVVLSSCQSAVPSWVGSHYDLALLDAFLLAGGQAVLGSLWPVEDGFTAQFMEVFYTRLARGEDFQTALHQTKIWAQNKQIAPRYWAGFVLVGEPSRTLPYAVGRRTYFVEILTFLGLVLLTYGVFRLRNQR